MQILANSFFLELVPQNEGQALLMNFTVGKYQAGAGAWMGPPHDGQGRSLRQDAGDRWTKADRLDRVASEEIANGRDMKKPALGAGDGLNTTGNRLGIEQPQHPSSFTISRLSMPPGRQGPGRLPRRRRPAARQWLSLNGRMRTG